MSHLLMLKHGLMRRTLLPVLMVFMGLVSTSKPSYANEDIHQAKALFLYNFANFVDWPNDAFVRRRATLNLCVVGKALFVPYLDAFEGAEVRGRRLSIVKLPQVNLNRRCHILFLDEEEKRMIENIQVIHTSDYVLSVSDDDGFVEDGGVVSVFAQNQNIEFEVNLKQALENGLFISSDLLSIARSVKRE